MANISTGGWDQGRKSKSTGKRGAAIGGQAVVAVKLCLDCQSRPRDYGRNPEAVPCTFRPDRDVFEARDACKGRDWILRR